MICIDALKALVAAGATAEMVVALIEEMSRVTERDKRDKREKARIRKQKQRAASRVTSEAEKPAIFLKEEDKKDKDKKERKGSPRGKHALPPDWRPDATLTVKGDEELAKMRDWAEANAIRKASWPATWRNWVRRVGGGCETVTNPTPDIGFYAEFGSKEQEAWEAYAKKTGRRGYPRDKRGGWTFPTRWPPQAACSGELDERQPDARADTG